jgi:hypothetical protein
MIDELLSLIGRTTEPNLPDVNAISDDDLERMLAKAFRAGDNGRAERIKTIKQLRGQYGSPLDGQLLGPAAENSARAQTNSGRSIGQFANDSVAAYRSLNDALLTSPQRWFIEAADCGTHLRGLGLLGNPALANI